LTLGLISPEWTQRLLARTVETDATTVDFLLNLQIISVGFATPGESFGV
jgi:hypothetical protein